MSENLEHEKETAKHKEKHYFWKGHRAARALHCPLEESLLDLHLVPVSGLYYGLNPYRDAQTVTHWLFSEHTKTIPGLQGIVDQLKWALAHAEEMLRLLEKMRAQYENNPQH